MNAGSLTSANFDVVAMTVVVLLWRAGAIRAVKSLLTIGRAAIWLRVLRANGVTEADCRSFLCAAGRADMEVTQVPLP